MELQRKGWIELFLKCVCLGFCFTLYFRNNWKKYIIIGYETVPVFPVDDIDIVPVFEIADSLDGRVF